MKAKLTEIEQRKQLSDNMELQLSYSDYDSVLICIKIYCEGTYIVEQSVYGDEEQVFKLCEIDPEFLNAEEWNVVRKVDLGSEIKKFKKYIEKVLKI